MCLATPVKVIKLKDNIAQVDHDGRTYTVNTTLIKDLKVGDWIMTHGELGINKLPEADALEILELAKQSHCHCE
jgi:hydrogenase expression/formation protein HypC